MTIKLTDDEKFLMHAFIPNFSLIEKTKPTYLIKEFEKEIGVYSATPEFVINKCGVIANTILSCVPSSYYDKAKKLGLYPNCDIRIHRLYPGDYPAYPGWHCDGEYRETYFSQPNLNKIKIANHILCAVSSHPEGVSNFEFLKENFLFHTNIKEEILLWKKVNRDVNQAMKEDKSIETHSTHDGEIYMFDQYTLHRVMPTKNRGWRLLFRMSMWHKPNLGKEGMITKQEQVYLNVNKAGW